MAIFFIYTFVLYIGVESDINPYKRDSTLKKQ